MIYLGIGMMCSGIWIAFQIWKAPLLRENPDGSYYNRRIKENNGLF
jgi:hypothetical protein